MPAAPAARTIPIEVIAIQPWYIACASLGMGLGMMSRGWLELASGVKRGLGEVLLA